MVWLVLCVCTAAGHRSVTTRRNFETIGEKEYAVKAPDESFRHGGARRSLATLLFAAAPSGLPRGRAVVQGNVGLPRQHHAHQVRMSGKQQPLPAWPDTNTYHFIHDANYVVNKATGYTCKTPTIFTPTRHEGNYADSFLVSFTPAYNDEEPKTLELKRSCDSNPSFGAVKVPLPFDADVDFSFSNQRLVLANLKEEGHVAKAKLRKGDILRAISVPGVAKIDTSKFSGLFGFMSGGSAAVEEGMVMLDGKFGESFKAALSENANANGEESDVVVVVERPGRTSDDDDWWPFSGGRPEFVPPDLPTRLKELGKKGGEEAAPNLR